MCVCVFRGRKGAGGAWGHVTQGGTSQAPRRGLSTGMGRTVRDAIKSGGGGAAICRGAVAAMMAEAGPFRIGEMCCGEEVV